MVAPLLRLKIDSRAGGANPRTRADGIEAFGELGAGAFSLSARRGGGKRRLRGRGAGFIAETLLGLVV